jgi:Concanavalin A-like lectin/glucanases superfamily
VRFRNYRAAAAIAIAGAASACSALSGLDTYNTCTSCGDSGMTAAARLDAATDSPISEAASTVDADPVGDADGMVDGLPDEAGGDADGNAIDAARADGEGGGDAGSGVDASDAGDLAAGLVAFYKFDESSGASTALDSSGNGRNATLVGGPTFAAGLQGNAVTLDGSGSYVSLPSGIVSGLTSCSISAWVNLATNQAWGRIFDFGTGVTSSSSYMFLTQNNGVGKVRFAITTGGYNGEERIDVAPVLPTAAWQHVAVTLSGTTGTLYVQGVQVASNTGLTLTASGLGTTTQNWLGRSEFPVDPYLAGQLDNVRIYSRALSAGEVQAIHAGHL